jgi:tetratricopeptide (TPR) repeat protein
VLLKNPHIRSLSNIPSFFTDATATSVLPENRDVRPLLMITFALNYAISGNATWSYHLVNLALHWLAALLVFRIVRDHLWLGESAVPLAAAAALVVAAHPLNTEPVNYISARSALLTTVFYLAAFDAGARRRYAATLLFFACALLTKAIAMTLPFLLLAYWLLNRKQPSSIEERVPWALLVALILLDAAAGIYRGLLVPTHAIQSAHQPGVTPWTYFMTEWSAYLYYLRLFLWPDALVIDRLDYPTVQAFWQPQAWASLLVLVALAGLAWSARRSRPAITFAALWYLITLAAESSFFPLAEPVNEHRPYLAMLALGTLSALALWRLSGVFARWSRSTPSRALAVLVVMLTTSLAAATYGRNRTWRDEYTLWLDATRKAPNNPRAWLNAGNAAMGRNRDDEARTFLLRANELSPCYSYPLMNLSALAAKTHQIEESLRWADEAVRCSPAFALPHFYRGTALERLNRDHEALTEYRATTNLDPQNTNAWLAQGRLLSQSRRWPAAAHAFDRALASDPGSVEAAMQAGLLYQYRLRNPGRAVERYQTVLRLAPKHYGAHYQLARALLALGHEEEARAAWRAFIPLAQASGDRAVLANAPAALRSADQ